MKRTVLSIFHSSQSIFHLSLITLSLSFCLSGYAQNVAYSYTNKIEFTKSGNGSVVRFTAIMPVPQSNAYQDIAKLKCSDGQVTEEHKYGNRVLIVDRENFPGSKYVLTTTFDIRPIPVRIDVSKIKNIQPYDPESEPCKLHLGDRGEYIKTSHPYIVRIGDQLWAQSSNVLDYARRCYEYVATNFRYINGSWRTLDEILSAGGGECGDFSTLVVNLLRYKGIPSRHNICVRLNGGYHVWVDFYIEGYGWIPLDATYKNSNRNGDYFGYYDGKCVVLMQDFCYDIDWEFPVDILQTCYYYYWYDAGQCNISWYQYTLNNGVSTGITVPQAAPVMTDTNTYNMHGQRVNSSYKGIIITNGRKYLRK